MVTMLTLRMLVDLSFFCTFAGFLAILNGGSGAVIGIVLQSLCFGLSHLGGQRRFLRLALLLPMGLCWYLYRASLADCVLLLATAGYILWLVWQGAYDLELGRQQRLFLIFFRAAAAFLVLIGLCGYGAEMSKGPLPLTLVMLAGSVLLMRALRHEPRVYCGWNYQIINLSAVAAAAVVAYLLSTESVLRGLLAVGKAIYGALILPILMLMVRGMLLLFRGLIEFLGTMKAERVENGEQTVINDVSLESILGESGSYEVSEDLLKQVLIALAIIGGVVAAIKFFRWLAGGRSAAQTFSAYEERRGELPYIPVLRPEAESVPARGIRGRYRAFLKLCAEQGVRRKAASTSLDIDRQAREISGLSDLSGQIREIYIRARYGGKTDREDVLRMRRLCAQAKKEAGGRGGAME